MLCIYAAEHCKHTFEIIVTLLWYYTLLAVVRVINMAMCLEIE